MNLRRLFYAQLRKGMLNQYKNTFLEPLMLRIMRKIENRQVFMFMRALKNPRIVKLDLVNLRENS